MGEMSQAIQDLPLAGLIPVALLMLVGLMLWAAGRRVLRAGFGAAGLIVGGAIGLLLGTALGISPWIVALILGVILACLAALAHRVAVAGSLALVLGAAAPLAVVTVAELQGVEESVLQEPESPPGEPEGIPGLDREPDEFDRTFGRSGIPPEEFGEGGIGEAVVAEQLDLTDETRQAVGQARGYAERLLEAVRTWWSETPVKLRPTIVGAAVGGILVGVLFGALASSLSAAVVSSFGGALLWLSGLRIVLLQMGEPVAGWLPSSATASLTIWLIISLIGVAIQWMTRPKPADKPG
jgi:F0F1-type ATP synthase assembly protein I